MATISENLITINNIKSDLQQAILSKGGSAGNDFTTYADEVRNLPTGGGFADGTKFGHSTWEKVPADVMEYVNNSDNLGHMFYYCGNLKGELTITNSKATKSTVLMSLFTGCSSLTAINLPNISRVGDMATCFSTCSDLIEVSLPKLEYVSSLQTAFNKCVSLSRLELPLLTYVDNMSSCFSQCGYLTSVNLPKLQSASNMATCFSACSSLSSVNIPSLTYVENLSNCFRLCTALQELNMGAFATTGGTLWGLSYCTKLTHDSLIAIISALSSVSGQTLTLGTTNLAKLNEAEKSVATNKGWTLN